MLRNLFYRCGSFCIKGKTGFTNYNKYDYYTPIITLSDGFNLLTCKYHLIPNKIIDKVDNKIITLYDETIFIYTDVLDKKYESLLIHSINMKWGILYCKDIYVEHYKTIYQIYPTYNKHKQLEFVFYYL